VEGLRCQKIPKEEVPLVPDTDTEYMKKLLHLAGYIMRRTLSRSEGEQEGAPGAEKSYDLLHLRGIRRDLHFNISP
jgi:hypothetical protein